jgi:6-pyruvoyltetrahydropterin/6-carboxytetrahydropterin synthase
MYRISKEFSFAMGHRLSLHQGLCKNFHGHNYKVIVGIESEVLDKYGMVMDFSDLKNIVNEKIFQYDHALMININDKEMVEKMYDVIPSLKVKITPYEPTAENMAKEIYLFVAPKLRPPVQMDYITVYETDTSKATYTE